MLPDHRLLHGSDKLLQREGLGQERELLAQGAWISRGSNLLRLLNVRYCTDNSRTTDVG
jgi:hypothetical protein